MSVTPKMSAGDIATLIMAWAHALRSAGVEPHRPREQTMTDSLTPAERASRERLRAIKPRVAAKCDRFPAMLAAGKSIALIQLQYRYECNMRCEHCSVEKFRNRRGGRRLTIADVKNFYDQADAYGLAHTGISGGEPTIFPDLRQLIAAVGPERFHIQVDTNALRFTSDKAAVLKACGVDKVQISLDALDATAHDSFRRRRGAHRAALAAIDHAKAVGLQVQVATVCTKERLRSDEFRAFLQRAKDYGYSVSVEWPKLMGAWANRLDLLVTPEDVAYLDALGKEYPVYHHTTPCYGLDLGCLAVKRFVSLNAFGEVMPCAWIPAAMGNIFHEPLAAILDRGMKHFAARIPQCLCSTSREFVKALAPAYAADVPVPLDTIPSFPDADSGQHGMGSGRHCMAATAPPVTDEPPPPPEPARRTA
jgi:MoaA/NifB/PqqE/SkfB family radical SAM enzyme